MKRAPKAAKKRKVYEVEGPGQAGAVPLKDRARQIVTYFKKWVWLGWPAGGVLVVAMFVAHRRGRWTLHNA